METRHVANAAPNPLRNLESDAGATSSDSSASSRHPSVDLTALTQRDDFLLELGETLGGQAAVHPVDSIAAALKSIASTKRGQVLAIDARGLNELRAAVGRAVREAPHVIVLVFADSHAEKEVAAALKGTRVFAVLTLPIPSSKTAAVLDAAMHDALKRCAAAGRGAARPVSSGASARLASGAMRVTTAAAGNGEPRSHHRLRWAAIASAALVIATGAGWYLMRGRTSTRPATEAAGSPAGPRTGNAATLEQPAVDTSIVQGKVDDLLEKARRAMRERRYTAPKGDNALVYYRSALVADPHSGEAKDGLRRVSNVLVSRFNEAMANGAYADAALALATLRLAQPSDSRIGPFEVELAGAQISKALASGNLARAAALVWDAQQSGVVPAKQLASWTAQIAQRKQSAKTGTLAALFEARLQSDELTGPTGDSAQDYLSQLRSIAPTSPATQQAAQALLGAFFAKARQNGLAGNRAGVTRWLAAARADGASPGSIADFKRQLGAAQEQIAQARADRLLARVRARLAAGALTAPEKDSAAYYLSELEQSHPSAEVQGSAEREKGRLATALLARATQEMRSDDKSGAEADLSQAKSWGASEAAILAIESAAPHGTPAAKAGKTGPNFAQLAAGLKRIRYTAPQYPNNALIDRIAGSVTVQFVVDKRGDTRDVRIVESDPPGVFDRAVTEAVRAWRYRPPKYEGKPIAVPVRTLVRFELPK